MKKAKLKDILIGEGDDWPTDYGHGFDKPMATITDIMSESDNWDLPISWPQVLSGWENAGSLLDQLDGCSFVYELFYAVEGCSINRSRWGGDSPGRSGAWVSVFVDSGKIESALATVVKLPDALTKYWISSGKAAAAEECNREMEAKRAAEAAIKAEKERLDQGLHPLHLLAYHGNWYVLARAEQEDLSGFEEARKGLDRLNLLGGPLTPEQTAPAQG